MEPHLYSNQPSLTLISNGAECLMLNKKFYLENANEDCMKFLRESVSFFAISLVYISKNYKIKKNKSFQISALEEIPHSVLMFICQLHRPGDSKVTLCFSSQAANCLTTFKDGSI